MDESMQAAARIALSERRDAAELLWRCAQPELDALAEYAIPQDCVAILSDARGLILGEVGSAQFPPRNGAASCAAAPILTARGEPAGALDITGDAVRVDGHAMGLVRMAAAQVEHRMMQREGAGELIRFHWRAGLLGTAREGLAAIAGDRIVGLNRVAAGLLDGGWAAWLDAPAARLFGERWARLLDGPGLFVGPDGRQWAATGDAGAPRIHKAGARAAAPHADPLQTMLAQATRVLDAGLPVLVHGETGTGKEWFARRLHAASARAGGPFVAVNCGALPETLVEAELFGYEDGAFTGARRRGQLGRVREAHGGVLFLDEIGDMPLALQTRLLRVLEDQLVRPLGSARDVAVDFALVCASHRDLFSLVREGGFREDLLFRLNGFLVQLPPLRHRSDRHALIRELFERSGAQARRLRLSCAALEALAARPWRGNIRELALVLRRLVALADEDATIDLADLPDAQGHACAHASPVQEHVPPGGDARLAALERRAARDALTLHQGRVAPAARALGVHRSTLYRWLRDGRPAE